MRERIKPYFLRRLKSEVFGKENVETTVEMPKKNELIVWLKLTPCQVSSYCPQKEIINIEYVKKLTSLFVGSGSQCYYFTKLVLTVAAKYANLDTNPPPQRPVFNSDIYFLVELILFFCS